MPKSPCCARFDALFPKRGADCISGADAGAIPAAYCPAAEEEYKKESKEKG